ATLFRSAPRGPMARLLAGGCAGALAISHRRRGVSDRRLRARRFVLALSAPPRGANLLGIGSPRTGPFTNPERPVGAAVGGSQPPARPRWQISPLSAPPEIAVFYVFLLLLAAAGVAVSLLCYLGPVRGATAERPGHPQPLPDDLG